MKIIRQSNGVSPFQKRTRVCGWKEINRRGREGDEGKRWEDSVNLKENGQKTKADNRRELMRGQRNRMG